MDRLTAFSHVVLTLVGTDGAGPHDLVRMARQGRIYADFADSQWYAEPKRLEKLGYLSSRKEPGRTRERTTYALTAKGRTALREWMREPTPFSRIQLEPAWRLLAADIAGDEAVLESLRPLREEIDDLRERIDVAERVAHTLPNRERYLMLNHRLARRIVDAHAEWLDEVERELAPASPGTHGSGACPGRRVLG
jgi:DNA-binding PadR family transcriptional regulator